MTFKAVLFASFLVSSCGENILKDEGSKDGAIDSSFTIEPTHDGYALRLAATALGQRFLLSPAVAKGPPYALSVAGPALIVFFERKGDALYLFEDPAAEQIAPSRLPTYRLLASMPLIDEPVADRTSIVFDFNKGITAYLATLIADGSSGEDPVDAPDDGGGINPDQLKHNDIVSTYLNKSYVKDGRLYVDQVVELAGPDASELAEVKYTLMPYTLDASFPRREADPSMQEKAGYFESAGVFDERGIGHAYVNKWRTDKPIVYYISPNTPMNMRESVKDGVLYWNRVFGREVLAVSDLPEGVTPHEPGYNVIQWLEADLLTFAYADWTSDPITGEITQAQIFIPSFMALTSRDAARLLQRMTQAPVNPAATFKPPLSAHDRSEARLRMARQSHARCAASDLATRAGAYGLELMQDTSDADAIRMAQDSVRTVVAHEVGHTLGLRHNFTAKTAATLPPNETFKAVADYLKTGNPPAEKTLSGSVMDYQLLSYEAMTGAQIRLGQKPLPYDEAAIRWAYSTDDFRTIPFGGYCSDEDQNRMPDCLVFVAPGEPITGNFASFVTLGERAAGGLATQFVAARAPYDGTSPIPVNEVALDPASDARSYMARYTYVLQMLRDLDEAGVTFRSIRDQFAFRTDYNRSDELKAILKYQTDAVTAAGGLAAMIEPLLPVKQGDGSYRAPLVATAEARFLALVDTPQFKEGVGSSGATYAFTDDDIAYIKSIAPGYFQVFAETVVTSAMDALTTLTPGPWAGVDPATLAKELQAYGTAVITAESGDDVTGQVLGKPVTVKKPYYSKEIMLQAVDLFDSNLYDAYPDDFNKDAGKDAYDAIVAKLDVITNKGAATADDLPKELKILALDIDFVARSIP